MVARLPLPLLPPSPRPPNSGCFPLCLLLRSGCTQHGSLFAQAPACRPCRSLPGGPRLTRTTSAPFGHRPGPWACRSGPTPVLLSAPAYPGPKTRRPSPLASVLLSPSRATPGCQALAAPPPAKAAASGCPGGPQSKPPAPPPKCPPSPCGSSTKAAPAPPGAPASAAS